MQGFGTISSPFSGTVTATTTTSQAMNITGRTLTGVTLAASTAAGNLAFFNLNGVTLNNSNLNGANLQPPVGVWGNNKYALFNVTGTSTLSGTVTENNYGVLDITAGSTLNLSNATMSRAGQPIRRRRS